MLGRALVLFFIVVFVLGGQSDSATWPSIPGTCGEFTIPQNTNLAITPLDGTLSSLHVVPHNPAVDLSWFRSNSTASSPAHVDVTYTLLDKSLGKPTFGNVSGNIQVIGDVGSLQRNIRQSLHLQMVRGTILNTRDVLLRAPADDATRIRELLTTEIYAAMCIASAAIIPVKVFLRKDFAGLYMMNEWIGQGFVDRVFGKPLPDITLYKMHRGFSFQYLGPDVEPYENGCYKKSEKGVWSHQCQKGYTRSRSGLCCQRSPMYTIIPIGLSDTSAASFALSKLLAIIHNGTDDELAYALDMESLLRLMVVDLSVGQWDDFWRVCNNFYLYKEGTGKPFFRVIPIDVEMAFDPRLNWGGFRSKWDDFCCIDAEWACVGGQQHLARRALSGSFRQRFFAILDGFLMTLFQPGPTSPLRLRIEALYTSLRPTLLMDDACQDAHKELHVCPTGDFDSEFGVILSYVHDRACFLLGSLLHDVICTSWPACFLPPGLGRMLHHCGASLL